MKVMAKVSKATKNDDSKEEELYRRKTNNSDKQYIEEEFNTSQPPRPEIQNIEYIVFDDESGYDHEFEQF
jgi:hypothetical protein